MAETNRMPHRTLVSTTFLIAGIYWAFIVIRDFNSILATWKVFFDLSPAWYAYALTIATATVPLAFLLVAFLVYRTTKWWLVAIPAAYGIVFALGYFEIALGVYLIWYFATEDRRNAALIVRGRED